MARKKAKRSRRRNPNSIKLLPLAEAYLQFNVLTQGATNTNPVQFLFGKTQAGAVMGSQGLAYGANSVSLKELITRFSTPHGGSGSLATMSESEIVWDNIQKNWVNMAFQSVAIGAGFKVGKKLLRKPISQANRMLKMAGIKSVVSL